VFVPGKLFQPSLMFGGKARGQPLKDASLGHAPALPANIKLGCKGLPGTNILGYFENP